MEYEEIAKVMDIIDHKRVELYELEKKLRAELKSINQQDQELFEASRDLFEELKKLDYERTKIKYPGTCL